MQTSDTKSRYLHKYTLHCSFSSAAKILGGYHQSCIEKLQAAGGRAQNLQHVQTGVIYLGVKIHLLKPKTVWNTLGRTDFVGECTIVMYQKQNMKGK